MNKYIYKKNGGEVNHSEKHGTALSLKVWKNYPG